MTDTGSKPTQQSYANKAKAFVAKTNVQENPSTDAPVYEQQSSEQNVSTAQLIQIMNGFKEDIIQSINVHNNKVQTQLNEHSLKIEAIMKQINLTWQ